ncbi:MAG: hypothetical protein Q9168_008348, partial [Polycauliona sp. 1 TL-2023]
MVKPAFLIAACLSAMTTLVTADNCRNGLSYCGSGLLKKGNYYNEIVAELQRNRQGVDPAHVSQSLFQCHGNGAIVF